MEWVVTFVGMSLCTPCVQINPLPECIYSGAYDPYYMEVLEFTDIDTNMIAKIEDVATGSIQYIDFVTDANGDAVFEIQSLFPLMDHVYTINFTNSTTGNPSHFTITNTDGSTDSGCCITFGINKGQTDSNGFFMVSTQGCQV